MDDKANITTRTSNSGKRIAKGIHFTVDGISQVLVFMRMKGFEDGDAVRGA